MKSLLCKICVLCLLLVSISAYCQESGSDSSAALKFYFAKAGDQLPIYSAVEYRKNRLAIAAGSLYFLTDSLSEGVVFYDGLRIQKVRLLYNQLSGELLTTDYLHRTLVRLIQLKVEWFEILGHRFINIQSPGIGLEPGYYEEIFKGNKITAIKKQKKRLDEQFISQEIERTVLTDSSYFALTDTIALPIKSQSALLDLFGSYRKQVAAHLRTGKFRYKRQKEATIVEAFRFYETISLK